MVKFAFQLRVATVFILLTFSLNPKPSRTLPTPVI